MWRDLPSGGPPPWSWGGDVGDVAERDALVGLRFRPSRSTGGVLVHRGVLGGRGRGGAAGGGEGRHRRSWRKRAPCRIPPPRSSLRLGFRAGEEEGLGPGTAAATRRRKEEERRGRTEEGTEYLGKGPSTFNCVMPPPQW